jgi:hypothetical protein
MGILNLISGIIFLGTPHKFDDQGILAEKSMLLLKSYPNEFSKQTVLRLEKDSTLLFGLAKRFEDVMLRVDIASVFETKEACVKDGTGPFSKTRKAIVCVF